MRSSEIVRHHQGGTTTIDVGPLLFGAWQARLLVTFAGDGSATCKILGYREPSKLPPGLGWTGGDAYRWLFPQIAEDLDRQAAAWFAANRWRLSRDAARAAA
jgi:hypothetical protein